LELSKKLTRHTTNKRSKLDAKKLVRQGDAKATLATVTTEQSKAEKWRHFVMACVDKKMKKSQNNIIRY
jgi:hypothetical protein